MKKLYILMIVLFAFNAGNAQWIELNPGTHNELYGIYFTDINTGYAVGSNGTIIKTLNGGNNWSDLTTGISEVLLSIQFPNPSTGYAVGTNGTIIKTIDYGNTWEIKSYDTAYQLNSIFFTDANNGYAVGITIDSISNYIFYGIILKTVNGGSTWTKLYFGPNNAGITSVFFTDANNGYAGGINVFLKTTNGGLTWIDTINAPSNLYSLFFVNANTGYLTADAGICKTIDAGHTWVPIYYSPYIGSITHIYFPSINTGYAIGDHSLILKTSNAGSSWTVQDYAYSSYDAYNSVYFINENIGFIVGSKQFGGGGFIYKTINGGVTNISEISTNENIILSPNPATSKLTINLQQLSKLQNTTVSIYDVQEKLLLQQCITQPQTELNIASFAKGIYVVKVNNDKQSMVNKFVKE